MNDALMRITLIQYADHAHYVLPSLNVNTYLFDSKQTLHNKHSNADATSLLKVIIRANFDCGSIRQAVQKSKVPRHA
jgi:hypothetical protein